MEYEHLKGLWFSDLTEKDDLEIDMLIGVDNLWQIQRGRIIRGEPGEPVAIEMTLGWTISGQLHGPSDQRINVNLVIENGEMGEDHEMKCLWDLETLGIKDTDDTCEELVDNIKSNDERYSVRLLWKAGYRRLPTNYQLCRSRLRGLKKLYASPQVPRYLQENKVKWRFNLELAPWWGGFFERLVGFMKRTLRKVLGKAILTYQELETVLTEVEGNLNNRPLTYEYEVVGEEMLIPNHLLYG